MTNLGLGKIVKLVSVLSILSSPTMAKEVDQNATEVVEILTKKPIITSSNQVLPNGDIAHSETAIVPGTGVEISINSTLKGTIGDATCYKIVEEKQIEGCVIKTKKGPIVTFLKDGKIIYKNAKGEKIKNPDLGK